MSEGNNHKHFSAADIARYHRGEMSPVERHALEKAALDDPFLADALEGYAHSTHPGNDLDEIRDRLSERVGDSKIVPIKSRRERFRWIRVAAAVIVLAGAAVLASQLLFNKEKKDIAESREKESRPAVATDTAGVEVTFGADSITTFPMIVEEEPSSGGQPSVAGSKPVTTGRADAVVVNPAKQEGSSQPLDVTEVKDDAKTAPAVTVPSELAGAPEKTAEDVAKKTSGEEVKKMSAAQSRSMDKNRYNEPVNIIRGRVTDEFNRGLPFANITSTRDKLGTYTDAAGNFTLNAKDSVVEVQVRSLGYDESVQQLRSSATENQVVLEQNSEESVQLLNSRNNSNAMRRQMQETDAATQEPQPADGWANYDLYLNNNVNIPADPALKKASPREVELSFEVNKSGQPVNIRVERSLCKPCDREAIRLLKEGPRWERNARKRTNITVAF